MEPARQHADEGCMRNVDALWLGFFCAFSFHEIQPVFLLLFSSILYSLLCFPEDLKTFC
jgi:hypothetical protein